VRILKIAVIGSNMVDLISYINKMPVAGETVEAPNFSIGCGGKGANQNGNFIMKWGSRENQQSYRNLLI
jgi:hypothetical protein